MSNFFSWFEVSRKKQDYKSRRQGLINELSQIKGQLSLLIEKTNHLTKTYGVEDKIKLIQIKTGNTFVAGWQFGVVPTTYKVKKRGLVYEQEYPLKVRDLGRLTDEQKQKLTTFLYSKDDVFLKEIVQIEKQRLAINTAVSTMSRIANYLDTRPANTLQEMLSDR